MRSSFRAKLVFVIFLGVLIPMGISVVSLRRGYRQNLEEAFVQQGRIMFNQLQVTRRWLSLQGGVYVFKRPAVQLSPYLDQRVDTATREGDPITLRSPDLVTRELSELAEKQGLFRFSIVSNTPINPHNLADPWAAERLREFEQGRSEAWAIVGSGRDSRFRYIAPLRTEASCLRCHQEFGFKVGEVRGGISVEFPVGEMLAAADRENLNLAIGAAAIGAAIMAFFYLGTRRIVLNPLSEVTDAISAMAKGDYDFPLAPRGQDELGDLARALIEMRAVIKHYSQTLEREVAARTRELEVMRGRAQKERDYLINLFERMADGVCVTAHDHHRLEYINPSLDAILGPNRETICRTIFGQGQGGVPEPSPGAEAVVRREVEAPGGLVFDVLASELQNPDGSCSWLLVFRDITKRKELEGALLEMNRTLEAKVREQTAVLVEQEKLATLGEVSAGLAHEIRNPLSAILSGISLLESSQRTPAERERILRLIKREAGRLNASLTDFLLFARPQEPKKVRIDLAVIIREIVHLVEDDPEIRGQNQIQLDLADLPPVRFDDDQLRQVIWNVTLNALQAMKGKGTLTFRTRAESEQGFRLEIEDTGPGIPANIRDRIFNPFFSTKKEGTGLGLSIVRRIVSAHGGTVRVESEEGKGTKLIIVAPRE